MIWKIYIFVRLHWKLVYKTNGWRWILFVYLFILCGNDHILVCMGSVPKPNDHFLVCMGSVPKPNDHFLVCMGSVPKPNDHFLVCMGSVPKPNDHFLVCMGSTPKPISSNQNGHVFVMVGQGKLGTRNGEAKLKYKATENVTPNIFSIYK